ncbi:MAG: 30S ribosomal protein S24e [Candidatus Micrarchaeota archaeon]
MDKIDIIVKKDIENKLLARREILCDAVYSESTPSREKIKEEVVKKLNLDPKLTVVAKINQLYGITKSEVSVYSYKNEEAMKIEPKFRLERVSKKKASEQQEQAKAEAASEEKK